MLVQHDTQIVTQWMASSISLCTLFHVHCVVSGTPSPYLWESHDAGLFNGPILWLLMLLGTAACKWWLLNGDRGCQKSPQRKGMFICLPQVRDRPHNGATWVWADYFALPAPAVLAHRIGLLRCNPNCALGQCKWIALAWEGHKCAIKYVCTFLWRPNSASVVQ